MSRKQFVQAIYIIIQDHLGNHGNTYAHHYVSAINQKERRKLYPGNITTHLVSVLSLHPSLFTT